MDPDAFSTFFKWDPRSVATTTEPISQPPLPRLVQTDSVVPASFLRARELEVLQDFFSGYGVRLFTAAKLAEMGFTVSTLMDMKDEEIDDVTATLAQVFRCDLLVGERYGIKCAVRAERRRLEEEEAARRRQIVPLIGDGCTLDALSQEGLSEEPMQETAVSGGDGTYGPMAGINAEKKKQRVRRRRKEVKSNGSGEGHQSNDEDGAEPCELRSREHPFIVTEPGEVARGKKNGLDYLFHLFDQCRQYLIQVQNIAKEKGEKCPTKVTNQVFRYAKKVGASYINKPKMRHYVHCYALHCLDEEASNAMRRAYKERGENVGSWRQACYKPLVAMTAGNGWDIDALFNSDPRLCIWYVPTKLRQLCHAERGHASTSALLGLPF